MTKKKQSQADDAAAKELCLVVATAMLDKKAQNVVSLDMSGIDGAICSYFVVCNADSTTQVDAIADNVEDHVRKTLEQKPRRIEGTENSLWILIDYVDVMVHVFQTEMRDFYRIEQFWADAVREEHTDEPPVVARKTVAKKTITTKAATQKATAVEPKKKVAATAKKTILKTTAKKTAVKKAAATAKTSTSKTKQA